MEDTDGMVKMGIGKEGVTGFQDRKIENGRNAGTLVNREIKLIKKVSLSTYNTYTCKNIRSCTTQFPIHKHRCCPKP